MSELCSYCCGSCIRDDRCPEWKKDNWRSSWFKRKYAAEKKMRQRGVPAPVVYSHQYAWKKENAGVMKASQKKYAATDKGKEKRRLARSAYNQREKAKKKKIKRLVAMINSDDIEDHL